MLYLLTSRLEDDASVENSNRKRKGEFHTGKNSLRILLSTSSKRSYDTIDSELDLMDTALERHQQNEVNEYKYQQLSQEEKRIKDYD